MKRGDSKELAELLHSTAIRLLRAVRRVDEASGSTAPRLSALSVVMYGGAMTLGELARAEQVQPPTMTRIVKALEEQGLVVKTRDEDDGRSVRIAATTKGKRLLLEGRGRRIRVLREQVEGLGVAEREGLARALETLRGVVERLG